jgi:hypothetical protein
MHSMWLKTERKQTFYRIKSKVMFSCFMYSCQLLHKQNQLQSAEKHLFEIV